MTWFDDLALYSYRAQVGEATMRHVGWLDRDHAFPTGAVPDAFVARLHLLKKHSRFYQTRGFHFCEFCPRFDLDDEDAPRGSAEILAVGTDGTRFAAPELIVHYVEAHRYRPPQVFIDAVLRVADVTLQRAWREESCLSCGTVMQRKTTGGPASVDLQGNEWLEFTCAGCGTSYRRTAKLRTQRR